MTDDLKQLLLTAMVCLTVVACAGLLRDCRNIHVTCDVKEPACVKMLEGMVGK